MLVALILEVANWAVFFFNMGLTKLGADSTLCIQFYLKFYN